MADFKVGSTTIANAKVGATQIQAVYVGSSLVWSAGTDVDYRASTAADNSTAGSYPYTSALSVLTTDYLVGWYNGKQTQSFSQGYTGGTATTAGWNDITSYQEVIGDSGNDYLVVLGYNTVSSAGTHSIESYVQYAGLGYIAVSDADSYSYSTATGSGTASVSNCTSNDLIVIVHTVQTLGQSYYYPSTPSGYTQLVQQDWPSGQGGATQYWTTTVYYKEGGSGTESYSGTSSGSYDGKAILRIYAS